MKTSLSKPTLGYIAILAWCLVSAFSRVYTSDLEQHFDPNFVSFFIFSLAALFFLLLSAHRIPQIFKKAKTSWGSMLGLNISTFASWFFILYPLKYIEPSLVSTISLGLTPIGTLLLGLFMYRQGKVKLRDSWMSLLFLFLIVVISYLIFTGRTGAPPTLRSHEIVSVVFCFVVGIGAAATSIFAKRLTLDGFEPGDISLIRFFLLLLVAAIVFGFSHHPVVLTGHSVLHLSIVAFTMVIVPMYLLFVSLRYLEPITVAMLFPLMPAMAFFLEFRDVRLHPNGLVIACILAIVVFSLLGGFFRYRQEKTAIASGNR